MLQGKAPREPKASPRLVYCWRLAAVKHPLRFKKMQIKRDTSQKIEKYKSLRKRNVKNSPVSAKWVLPKQGTNREAAHSLKSYPNIEYQRHF